MITSTDGVTRLLAGSAAAMAAMALVTFADGWWWLPIAVVVTAGWALAMRGALLRTHLGAWSHFLAIVLLLLSSLGWCRSACGGLGPHQSLLGLPTAGVGIAVHLVAGVCWSWRGWPGVVGQVASVVAVAGSLYYLAVLAVQGGFCASCVAVHGLMLGHAVAWLAALEARERWQWLGWVAGGTAALSWCYRPLAVVENHPEQLRLHLRSLGGELPVLSGLPSRLLVPGIDHPYDLVSIASPLATGNELLRSGVVQVRPLTADSVATGAATPVAVSPTVPAATAATHRHDATLVAAAPAERPTALAGRAATAQDDTRASAPSAVAVLAAPTRVSGWGSATAPVQLVVSLDPHCSACARQWVALQALRPRWEAGQLAVEVLLRSESSDGETAIDAVHAVALERPARYRALLDAAFAYQGSLSRDMLPDLVAQLSAAAGVRFEKRMVLERHGVLRQWRRDDTDQAQLLGSLSTPNVWLRSRRHPEQRRHFAGYAAAAVLDVGIDSLLSVAP
jgi:protein-disulfide isomerase